MLPKASIAIGVVAACLAAESPVRAAEPRGVDWLGFVTELDHFARHGGSIVEGKPTPSTSRSASTHEDPNPQNFGNAWFGVAPKVSVVARDWATSTRVLGERLHVGETLRLAASTRMIVGRARLSGQRFTPFVQVGIGQWRIDRNHLPLVPRMMEVASQVGTGFEIHVTKKWEIATEATMTSLLSNEASAPVTQTILWSTLVASRIEF